MIVGNKQLFTLFSQINSTHFGNMINLQFVPVHTPNLKLTLNGLTKIQKFKKRNKQLYNGMKNTYKDFDIVFFSKEFTSLGFYILDKLRPDNRLIHVPDPGCDVYQMSDRKPSSLKELVKLMFMMFLYNRHLRLGSAGRKLRSGFYKISDPYIEKNIDLKVAIDERKQLQQNFEIDKFTVAENKSYKIVYFDKDLVRDKLCEEATYARELNDVFSIVSYYCESNELAKKYKPNRTSKWNREQISYGDIVPDYIPAEMLYNKDVKVYIGSTSMAIANIPYGNIISIVFLFTFIQPELRDRSVANQELRKLGGTIHYPKTLSEFETILKKLTKR